MAKQTGTCKFFSVAKGWGFISPSDGTPDLFVHQSNISTDGFRSLAEGEAVEYEVEVDASGRAKAVDVTGPGGARPQGAPRPEFGGGGGGGGNFGSSRRDSYGGGGRGSALYAVRPAQVRLAAPLVARRPLVAGRTLLAARPVAATMQAARCCFF